MKAIYVQAFKGEQSILWCSESIRRFASQYLLGQDAVREPLFSRSRILLGMIFCAHMKNVEIDQAGEGGTYYKLDVRDHEPSTAIIELVEN